jgi:hypothetical protein
VVVTVYNHDDITCVMFFLSACLYWPECIKDQNFLVCVTSDIFCCLNRHNNLYQVLDQKINVSDTMYLLLSATSVAIALIWKCSGKFEGYNSHESGLTFTDACDHAYYTLYD